MQFDPNQRQRGVALIMFIVLFLLLFALGAAVSGICVVNLRASAEGNSRLKSYYLADSGVQLANFMLQTSGGSLPLTNFTESIADGSVTVNINPLGGGLYEVTSTGDLGGDLYTVEAHLEFTGAFKLEGAVHTVFDNTVAVQDGNIRFELRDENNKISGRDHDANGNLEGDQSAATHGLALNPFPGVQGFNINKDEDAVLQGSPAATTASAPNQNATLKGIRDNAILNADVYLNGGVDLDNDDVGPYGTAADPKLVYVTLGPEELLDLHQQFSGYGTLVIDVDQAELGAALKLRDDAMWHGLILVYFRGEAEVTGGSLVFMQHDSKIIGGLALYFNGEGVEIQGTGYVLKMQNNAKILFSSDLISQTHGLGTIINESVRVISYQVQ